MKFYSDKILLEIYYKGFKDELHNNKKCVYKNELAKKAYALGCLDAVAGDEIRNLDNQTNQQILNKIKE